MQHSVFTLLKMYIYLCSWAPVHTPELILHHVNLTSQMSVAADHCILF